MTADAAENIVIVGGGLAGARCCEQLRAQGYEGSITLVGAEPSAPYDRPPLSKAVLLGTRAETVLPIDFDKLDVRLRLGDRAIRLRPDEQTVETRTGTIAYDGLVIATGATPIRLPGDGEQLVLRTVQEAHRLRDRLVPGARVVVIGASWIGAEVATAALGRGCRVTCLEAGPAPVAKALGAEIGSRLVPWWSEVDLRLDTPVQRIDQNAVLLEDGTVVPADVVVVGVGARPETQWLDGSGLEIDCGVLVDERLRAAPGIVAVGDAAAWWSRRWSRRMRVEHWDDAAAGAAVAVSSLLAPLAVDGPVHDPVPYFWSDQFGHKLQYVGQHAESDTVVVRQSPGSPVWSAGWISAAGHLHAMLTLDRPRDMLQGRKLIAGGDLIDPDRFADPEVPLAEAVWTQSVTKAG